MTPVQPYTPIREPEKLGRLFFVGGAFTAVAGSAAVQYFNVPAAEGAMAASGWLVILYLVGRIFVSITSKIFRERLPQPTPGWKPERSTMWIAHALVAGAIFLLFAVVTLVAAGFYALVPLSWAVQPSLGAAAIGAVSGVSMLASAVLWACWKARVPHTIALAAKIEFLNLSAFLVGYGRFGRRSRLATVRLH